METLSIDAGEEDVDHYIQFEMMRYQSGVTMWWHEEAPPLETAGSFLQKDRWVFESVDIREALPRVKINKQFKLEHQVI